MQIRKIRINEEVASPLALGMLFCDWHIHYLINTVSLVSGVGIVNVLYYALKYGIIAYYLYSLHMRIKKRAFISIFAIIALVMITAVFFPRNISYIMADKDKFLDVCWAMLLCCNVNCWNMIDTIVEKSTKLAGVIVGICYPINELLLGNHLASSSYMSMSYMILIGAIGFLYFGVKNSNYKDLIISGILVLEVCAAGARGPLLCIIAILFIAVIRLLQRNSLKAAGIIFLIAIIGALLYANFSWILGVIETFAGRYGMQLRLINMLRNSTLTTSTSTVLRDQFQVFMRQSIVQNPLGQGIYGDRVLGSIANIGVGYAHNLIYELLIEYGVVLGSAIIIWLVYHLTRHLWRKNNFSEATIDILSGMTLVKLFVSSSYWAEPLFFVLIYLLIIKERRKEVECIC